MAEPMDEQEQRIRDLEEIVAGKYAANADLAVGDGPFTRIIQRVASRSQEQTPEDPDRA